MLLPKDDIRRRLTGEFATEVSDASGMLLLDVAKRRWSKELLGKLELDESLLATCYESEEVTGKLTPAVAKQLGLSTDCVVVGGAGDCAAERRRQRHRHARDVSPLRSAPAASCSSTATKCRSIRSAGCTRSATPSTASGT